MKVSLFLRYFDISLIITDTFVTVPILALKVITAKTTSTTVRPPLVRTTQPVRISLSSTTAPVTVAMRESTVRQTSTNATPPPVRMEQPVWSSPIRTCIQMTPTVDISQMSSPMKMLRDMSVCASPVIMVHIAK